MGIRTSQAALDVVTGGDPDARVTQVVIEVVSSAILHAVASQVVVEVVTPSAEPDPDLPPEDPAARVSQVAVEVVTPSPALPPEDRPPSRPFTRSRTMPVVVGLTALARALVVVEAELTDLQLKLMKEPVDLSPTNIIADFTEADFSGYSAAAVGDTGVIYADAAGNLVWEASQISFQLSGGVVGNTIHGWWLEGTVGGSGARFVCGERFETPVSLTTALDAVFVRPRIPLGQPR